MIYKAPGALTRTHNLESHVETKSAPEFFLSVPDGNRPTRLFYSPLGIFCKKEGLEWARMAGEPDFTEQRIEGETVCDAGFMRMIRDRVRLHNGKETVRYVVRHCGAAAVVAQFEDDSLLLVRQFRYAVGRHTLEIPAGKIDAGSDPLATARRELREETGYAADDWRQIMHCHSSTGFTDEVLTVFHASGLRLAGSPAPDEHEHLQVVRIGLEEAWKLKQQGEITEARTLYALLWLRARGDELA